VGPISSPEKTLLCKERLKTARVKPLYKKWDKENKLIDPYLSYHIFKNFRRVNE
jgi:hypothetical protein